MDHSRFHLSGFPFQALQPVSPFILATVMCGAGKRKMRGAIGFSLWLFVTFCVKTKSDKTNPWTTATKTHALRRNQRRKRLPIDHSRFPSPVSGSALHSLFPIHISDRHVALAAKNARSDRVSLDFWLLFVSRQKDKTKPWTTATKTHALRRNQRRKRLPIDHSRFLSGFPFQALQPVSPFILATVMCGAGKRKTRERSGFAWLFGYFFVSRQTQWQNKPLNDRYKDTCPPS